MDNLTPEQIKAMISMLQQMLPSSTSQNEDDSPVVKASTPKKRSPKTKPETKSQNKFDQMMERSMHKEDILIDKKLLVQPPTPRARPFRLVKVACRVCGKQEEVNPGLIPDSLDRYKCNKCATSAG